MCATLLILSGCAAVPPRGGPEVALSGTCEAWRQAGEPERAAATFQNEAHDGLHALAGDARLSRQAAARVLEAKYHVEADIEQERPDPAELRDHLRTLYVAAAAAATELDAEVEECGR